MDPLSWMDDLRTATAPLRAVLGAVTGKSADTVRSAPPAPDGPTAGPPAGKPPVYRECEG